MNNDFTWWLVCWCNGRDVSMSYVVSKAASEADAREKAKAAQRNNPAGRYSALPVFNRLAI